jgi:uncharacterized protein (TIGR03437 family)
MKRTFSTLALALLVGAGAQAASVSSTLTLTGTATLGAAGFTIAGNATMTGVYSGSGTFASTISIAGITSSTVTSPFTITVTGGTLTGTYSEPIAVLTGESTADAGNVSATITGGTGSFAGYTGSFPALAGSSSQSGLTTYTYSFTGTGTVNTSGGGTTTPTPAITAVQDAASNTPNIAQGSIFIVKGSNLSASGYTPFGLPRPTNFGGVKVTFTPVAGGTGTDAYLVYLYNQSGVNQIACILPSTVAAGSYNVTVTNGSNASAGFLAQVVANKVGLFTQDSTGTGLTSLQNYISASVVDLNRLTTGSISGVTISPAHPGQAVIAYGTGLGPLAAGDNSTAGAYHDFSTSMTIKAVVGGVSIPVAYAGRAGYPGEDQINFTLPGNVQTGCAVPLQISVNGNLSAATTISIAPDANASACVQPGYTTAQLQKFDNGGTITTGGFSITQFSETVDGQSVKLDSIAGAFSQITGFQLGAAATANPTVGLQSGSCIVVPFTTAGTTSGVSAGGKLTSLDAGVVSINGPAGSSLTNQALTEDASYDYSYTSYEGLGIPGQASFSLVAGTYTLSGAGGKDVGSFSTSLTLGSPLVVTGGLPSTVVRSAGLPLSWTGGQASDQVVIVGLSENTTGSGSSAVTSGAEFICITTAGKGGFTVPASILTQLPASAQGVLELSSGNNSTSFTAPLKAGGSIDVGYFGSFLGIGGAPAYQ